ncbi:uncharacterized protein LOC108733572 [Agrilus planipennis]|uniref:Uncharacterized protein LOC108733572 n=1 Tax=Agrilus planipennis TaxID=224129 RepID=A0A1W4WJR5_AGRPL|nr:uncharacterized protein LOC108733572 [Agrilus planipennis]
MGLQTFILLGIVSISVINICVASVIYDATGSPKPMWPILWRDPSATSTDFLARAQEIAAAKVNKGFEMKKEGIKIAQQSMMNKFAMLGADESKKATTKQPPTTPELSPNTERLSSYNPQLPYSSSEVSEEDLLSV